MKEQEPDPPPNVRAQMIRGCCMTMVLGIQASKIRDYSGFYSTVLSHMSNNLNSDSSIPLNNPYKSPLDFPK